MCGTSLGGVKSRPAAGAAHPGFRHVLRHHQSVTHTPDLRHLARAIGASFNDVYSALRAIDYEYNIEDGKDLPYIQQKQELVSWACGHIYRRLYFALEVSGAPLTAARLRSEFEQFILPTGAAKADEEDFGWDEERDYEYRHLRILTRYRLILDDAFPEPKTAELSPGIQLLENILNNTPHLLTTLGVFPLNERDVYTPAGKFLAVAFPDRIKEPDIGQHLKVYKPEFGIPSLRAAIEYKYIDNEQELKVATEGIMTDVFGYAGSAMFDSFYAVLYLTDVAIATPQAIKASLGRLPPQWKVLPVYGQGERKKRGTTTPPT